MSNPPNFKQHLRYFASMESNPNNIQFIQENDWKTLKQRIVHTTGNIYVLVDGNTLQHCYPILLQLVPELKVAELIELEVGEESKDLDICKYIWQTFTENKAGRDSLILNLGGGVVGDLGGFVASIYKRGISYIQIPTTLLAMVDAAIGGKTGVDFMSFKNQLGVFSTAEQIIIWEGFLKSLPKEELRSGFAEALKHSLIADKELWNKLKDIHLDSNLSNEIIREAVGIKAKIVEEDPFEKGKRKILNFGHTVGHAIETYFLKKGKPIRHGEAVAVGMICAAFLSNKKSSLPKDEMLEIIKQIDFYFPRLKMNQDEIPSIIDNLSQDKKNLGDKNQFVLLERIGKSVWDVEIEKELLEDSLSFYLFGNEK